MPTIDTGPALRQRKPANALDDTSRVDHLSSASRPLLDAKPTNQDGPFGKTPDGTVFTIPQTHDMLSSLFDPRFPKSNIDLLTLFLLGTQVFLFLYLSTPVARPFFLVSFAVWRLAYNAGLGYVLTKQSKTRWIVKTVQRNGWMDENKNPKVTKWVRNELMKKMGKAYDPDAVPLEFNVWILFRHSVDVILLNDFLSYLLFTLTYLEFPGPAGHSAIFHVLRWTGGVILLLFNLWVKTDAHKIVKDYAWYWGDAFFLSLQDLVFDGVFELAPHPMYSVGYAGYYAMSLLVFRPTVLFVSLAAHACQFGFLQFFETPHIERVYGVRKPIAARTPLVENWLAEANPAFGESESLTGTTHTARDRTMSESSLETPSLTTEGNDESGQTTPHEVVTEAEDDDREIKVRPADSKVASSTRDSIDLPSPIVSKPRSLSTTSLEVNSNINKVMTRHDLDNTYFMKDLLVFKNWDAFRARDLTFGLLLFYSVVPWFLPALSRSTTISLLFANALAWRSFHTVALGVALKKQSERKWIVRHFLKHYHYEGEGEAVKDAFGNWKAIYNTSLCMTYASFLAMAWKCYNIPSDWTVGSELVRHTLGLLLIALHVWSAQSTYEVLGGFGWFYGDFFIPTYPHELYYTGIFRFLNNPERSMGGAAFFGISLISGSKTVAAQALIAVVAHWWFLSFVENPHMQRLYGNTLRKDAGVTKTLRNVAKRNAPHVLDVAGRISKNVKEVQGTVEKVLEETADAVEEFLSKSAPTVKGYVQDTKILLQQSGERFVISRVATDLASYDQTHYSLAIRDSTFTPAVPHASTSSAPSLRFHLGEPITLDWTAPSNHSRKDWVGIYRLGANKSKLVTRVSSQGKWVGVFNDEWNGDQYAASGHGEQGKEKGTVTFSGKKLPWRTGLYELRYHHDGKHSVMASAGPIEIFVDRPSNPDEPAQARETLTKIVAKTLAMDPAVIPASARHLVPACTPVSSSPIGLATPASGVIPSGDKGKSVATGDDGLPDESVSSSGLSSPTSPDSTTSAPLSPGGTSTRALTLSDEDDFVLYTTQEAEHISYAIEQAFGVELDKEVVLAAANVSKLASRVLEARRLLRPGEGRSGKSDRKEG
ncbi:hypothetical protein JCM10212_005952 [Sporobolomyces blumeae]